VDAVAAAVAVAREHGLRVDEPRVLKDAHNLVVHLEPSPVVARVGRLIAELRPRSRQRELALALWLAERGLPVVAPARELPQVVHERGGHTMTFWPLVERGDHDGRAASAALRELHAALPEFDGDVMGFWPVDETRELLATRVELPALVSDALEHVARELRYEPVLVHGDAHLNNCFFTDGGVLWGDFEDACLAPLEWDAAAIETRADVEYERALACLDVDPERLRVLVVLRILVDVVWIAMRLGSEQAEERLEWLRRNAS
jgi:Ser/Thr protein kinase RdoA (MazF antagonist)